MIDFDNATPEWVKAVELREEITSDKLTFACSLHCVIRFNALLILLPGCDERITQTIQ